MRVPRHPEQVDELLYEHRAGRLGGFHHRQVAEARVGAVVIHVVNGGRLVERHAPHARRLTGVERVDERVRFELFELAYELAILREELEVTRGIHDHHCALAEAPHGAEES